MHSEDDESISAKLIFKGYHGSKLYGTWTGINFNDIDNMIKESPLPEYPDKNLINNPYKKIILKNIN